MLRSVQVNVFSFPKIQRRKESLFNYLFNYLLQNESHTHTRALHPYKSDVNLNN